jgi:hypothetical protein
VDLFMATLVVLHLLLLIFRFTPTWRWLIRTILPAPALLADSEPLAQIYLLSHSRVFLSSWLHKCSEQAHPAYNYS